jgi:hypothetical protein
MKDSKLHLAKSRTTKKNIKQLNRFQTANFLYQLISEILMGMILPATLEIREDVAHATQFHLLK